jgi:Ca2+ transporting ATPase
MRKAILDKYILEDFAGANGLRTFAYAYKDMNSDHWESLQSDYNNFVNEHDREIVEEDLIFVAGFGIEDTLREKVGVSVLSLKQAGVTVRMISGDNLLTATRAAVQAGIINEGQRMNDEVCMNGEDLMDILGGNPILTEVNGKEVYSYPPDFRETIDSEVRKIRVLARCTPEHKFAFIVALQTGKTTVAVTADGLNDVRAL